VKNAIAQYTSPRRADGFHGNDLSLFIHAIDNSVSPDAQAIQSRQLAFQFDDIFASERVVFERFYCRLNATADIGRQPLEGFSSASVEDNPKLPHA
jgi:hypothetical protein